MAVPTGMPRASTRNATLWLRRSRQVDKDCDENQHRISRKTKNPSAKARP